MLEGLRPIAVVQTHGHWDHVRAWADLRADPGLPVWGHAGDVPLYPVAPDRLLADGERIPVGAVEVEVLHVPGHTEGSLLFAVDGAATTWLLTGDSLFPGGPGATSGDAGTGTKGWPSARAACSCAAVTDAPLRFRGVIPRLLQAFVKI